MYFVLSMKTINQYLPHRPRTELSVLSQYTFTKITCMLLPAYAQLEIIQFLPSEGSDINVVSLKSNNI